MLHAEKLAELEKSHIEFKESMAEFNAKSQKWQAIFEKQVAECEAKIKASNPFI